MMRCPRKYHAPVTDDGRIVAALLPQIVTQVRVSMGGIAGLDLPACLALTDAAGVDRDAAIQLLRGVEAGLLRAMRLRSVADAGADL